MAGVCSWCGTSLNQASETVEFLCPVCMEKAKQKASEKASPRRNWQPWMPDAPYPKLDRGDTRKV